MRRQQRSQSLPQPTPVADCRTIVRLSHISCRFFCYNRGVNETGGQNAAVAGLHFLRALQVRNRRFWYEQAGMKISGCNGFIITSTWRLAQSANPARM